MDERLDENRTLARPEEKEREDEKKRDEMKTEEKRGKNETLDEK